MSGDTIRDVRATVISTAAEVLAVDSGALARDGELHRLPAFNSFRMVELVERIEELLGVEADPSGLTPETLRTVDGFCRLFERAAGPPADPAALLEQIRPVVREHAARTDRDASFPVEALEALRRSGLLGLLVPVRYGGLGGTTSDMLAVAGGLSRECVSVGMIYAMHCQQVAALTGHASEELRAALLPRVARGGLYMGSVTTEPGKGGHLLTSSSPLGGDASVLRLERTAPVVTGGAHADGFLVSMAAPDAASPNRVSLVYADRDQLEITVTGGWNPLGMRATHSVPMRLAGDIPARQVVGGPGGFRDIVLRTFAPLAHVGWAACWLGAADGALARVVRLLRAERDRRDLGSELLLRRLSRARQHLDTVHAVLRHATGVLEDPATDVTSPPVQLLLNAVKLTASEKCPAAVDELIELTGMFHGYLRDSPLALERTLRDLRSAPLNYSNDRLHAADGALVLMDRDVRHA
ncbi:acyl-CoA dehydrogenase family protein [Streptomyces sp. TRM 70361]|uniref:acyl-CoA dehydrogenase family protein n=1 Tax=Streptomyces sp. TRM 70361 TaxID=3116553 RepID=UPI002E7C39F5|nr:acyl-CoA dehydrogenase family protein [Streptomyces sp. TRM 70361]MEE1942751.1 acyl-CoA dehydrogenase family protein [Streptomyces sp. TRM 70361]